MSIPNVYLPSQIFFVAHAGILPLGTLCNRLLYDCDTLSQQLAELLFFKRSFPLAQLVEWNALWADRIDPKNDLGWWA